MSTMLPAIPGTFGRLSDVFVSCLGAITGTENRLGFRPAKRIIAVLVDGLGSQNLKAAGGHAPFLNQALAKTKPISCGFPSTTATSIASFATGTHGGQHGFVGYKVYDRGSAEAFNLLNGWNEKHKSVDWQLQPTVSKSAVDAGVGAFFIGPKAYEDSDFTQATMTGAKYLAGRTIADRFRAAEDLLRRETGDLLAYLYVPELDQIGHAAGVNSDKWLQELENLDSEMRRLAASLGRNDALLLTADHGVVDIPSHNQVYLDEIRADWGSVLDVSGDPRVNFVYLAEQTTTERLRQELQTGVGERGLVLTRQQVLDAGWYGETSEVTAARLPELFVLATKNVAFYHRGYAPAASLNMIGQHGALSSVELSIPLLGWGKFGS